MNPPKVDIEETDKCIQMMVWKCAQIIVQSSQGRISANGTPREPRDWFELSFEDDPVVEEECNKALQNNTMNLYRKLNIEVSLTTSDNVLIPLEIWTIGIANTRTPQVKAVEDIYSEMILLLEVIREKARTTVSHRLSTTLTSQPCPISYRMFMGPHNCNSLGDEYSSYMVGDVHTHFEDFSVTLHVRTLLPTLPTTEEHLEVYDDGEVNSELKDPRKIPCKVTSGTTGSSDHSASGASECDSDNRLIESSESGESAFFEPQRCLIEELLFRKFLLLAKSNSRIDVNSELLEQGDNGDKEQSLDDEESDEVDEFVVVKRKLLFPSEDTGSPKPRSFLQYIKNLFPNW